MKQFTLPKTIRICKKKHFENLFQNAKKLQNFFIKISFARAFNQQGKVAFIAGKYVGKAVIRNKCKRQLREIYRLNQHCISKEYDIAFIAKSGMVKQPYATLQYTTLGLLKKGDLIIQK